MPLKYEIDKQRGIVFTCASGGFTDTDALADQMRLKADPDFDPEYRQLLDFSDVNTFELTPAGVRSLASGDPWGEGARRAFVAPNDLAFGMLRMHQCYVEDRHQEIIVVRTMSEAINWLELDNDKAD